MRTDNLKTSPMVYPRTSARQEYTQDRAAEHQRAFSGVNTADARMERARAHGRIQRVQPRGVVASFFASLFGG